MALLRTVDRGLIMLVVPIWYWGTGWWQSSTSNECHRVTMDQEFHWALCPDKRRIVETSNRRNVVTSKRRNVETSKRRKVVIHRSHFVTQNDVWRRRPEFYRFGGSSINGPRWPQPLFHGGHDVTTTTMTTKTTTTTMMMIRKKVKNDSLKDRLKEEEWVDITWWSHERGFWVRISAIIKLRRPCYLWQGEKELND